MESVALTAFYALLGIGGVGINCLANRGDWSRHEDTVSASFLLFLLCLLSIVSVETFGKPEGFRPFPFMDIIGGLYILSICVKRFAWWKLALTLLFLLQLVFHAGYWWGWPTPLTDNAYLARVNVTYAAQVVTAASLGGWHVAKTVLARRRGRAGRRHHLGNGIAR